MKNYLLNLLTFIILATGIGCASLGGNSINMPKFPKTPSKQVVVNKTIIVDSPDDVDLNTYYIAGKKLGGANPDDTNAVPIFQIVKDGIKIGTKSKPLTYSGGDGVHLYANNTRLWLHGMGGEDALSTPRQVIVDRHLETDYIKDNIISGYFEGYLDKTIQFNSGRNNTLKNIWDKNSGGKTLKIDGKVEKGIKIDANVDKVVSLTTVANADGPTAIIYVGNNKSAKKTIYTESNGGKIKNLSERPK
jgi:hypothetical protein